VNILYTEVDEPDPARGAVAMDHPPLEHAAAAPWTKAFSFVTDDDEYVRVFF
jgi:hypothetical protein